MRRVKNGFRGAKDAPKCATVQEVESDASKNEADFD
jgi:hypothetical protein